MASPPIRDSGIALPISQAGTSNLWGYTQDLLQNFIKPVECDRYPFIPQERDRTLNLHPTPTTVLGIENGELVAPLSIPSINKNFIPSSNSKKTDFRRSYKIAKTLSIIKSSVRRCQFYRSFRHLEPQFSNLGFYLQLMR